MRKFLSVLAAVLLSGSIAFGMNIPFVSGIVDPTNLPGVLNALIQSMNFNGPGFYAGQFGPVGSPANTTEQILAQSIVPTNTITAAGQGFRMKCAGTTAVNGHTKTVGLYFGSIILSSAAFTLPGAEWELDLVVNAVTMTGSNVYSGTGTVATSTVATPVVLQVGNDTATTDAFTGAVTAKCDSISGTAGASDVVVDQFLIEQIK